MAEMQSTQSVLIVSSTQKSAGIIANLLNPSLCYPIHLEKTGSGTRQRMQTRRYDLIIVNTPLSDEFGHELAVDLARLTTSGVVLLAKSDIYDEMCDRVSDEGVVTVMKPLSGQLFSQAVRMSLAGSMRLQNMERETQNLKKKLEELKLVDRAKCLLVEYQHMNEAEAHRYIEKQAMDQRKNRKEIARQVIQLYEG